MADLANVVAVFIIVWIIRLRTVDVPLQVGLQFGVVQFAFLNFRILRHITGGYHCRLYAGEHSGAGGKQGAAHGKNKDAHGDDPKDCFVGDDFLRNGADHLPGCGQDIGGVLCPLCRLPCCCCVFPFQLLLLDPF